MSEHDALVERVADYIHRNVRQYNPEYPSERASLMGDAQELVRIVVEALTQTQTDEAPDDAPETTPPDEDKALAPDDPLVTGLLSARHTDVSEPGNPTRLYWGEGCEGRRN